ncbi:MAG: tyrosine-type recombinase/integrase [Acidimicrobiales bacterium]
MATSIWRHNMWRFEMTRRQFGRVRKLPSGRWQARYPLGDGRLITAPQTFATKTDASTYLAMTEADLMRGQYIDPRAGNVSFADWSGQWLQRAGKRRNSMARDRQALEVFMEELGPRPLATITPMHIQDVVDARSRVAAPSTVGRDFSALRAVFNAAVEADIIGRSPCRRIALPKVRPPARVGVGPAEMERLASEVPARYRVLILVAGVLGLRWGEAVALRVRDIDFMRRTVTVAQVVEETAGQLRIVNEAKTAAGLRTLSAPSFLIEEIAEHLARHRSGVSKDEESLIFVGPRGGVLRRRFGERTFAPAVQRAGLDPSLTFHRLRHVAITSMVQLGVHPRVMQGRAGHATAKLTMELYAHVPEEADKQTAEALDRLHRPSGAAQRPVKAIKRQG